MGRPRVEPGAVSTEERILQAAELVFAREGFAPARLEDIARLVGIRRPSLLYHFGSKEALYAQIITRLFVDLAARLAEATLEGTWAERVDAKVTAFLAFLAERPATAPLLLREILDGQGPGRELLVAVAEPVIHQVEEFVAAARGGAAPVVPVREAILQVAMGAMVRAAAGDLTPLLWGPEDHSRVLARRLFVGEEGE